VSPILGIFASANQVQFIASPAFESIATVTVGGGGAASVAFTSIPSGYAHLQIRGISRAIRSGQTGAELAVQLNSDATTTNYRSHLLNGDGSSASAQTDQAFGGVYALRVPGSSALTNNQGSFVIDILDYASTVKNKTTRILTGYDNNGSGYISLASGVWLNSSTAISSVSIIPAYATSIDQYSSFALYGIKG
jgi:hypothetical protein